MKPWISAIAGAAFGCLVLFWIRRPSRSGWREPSRVLPPDELLQLSLRMLDVMIGIQDKHDDLAYVGVDPDDIRKEIAGGSNQTSFIGSKGICGYIRFRGTVICEVKYRHKHRAADGEDCVIVDAWDEGFDVDSELTYTTTIVRDVDTARAGMMSILNAIDSYVRMCPK